MLSFNANSVYVNMSDGTGKKKSNFSDVAQRKIQMLEIYNTKNSEQLRSSVEQFDLAGTSIFNFLESQIYKQNENSETIYKTKRQQMSDEMRIVDEEIGQFIDRKLPHFPMTDE